jgi:hypothetical protein
MSNEIPSLMRRKPVTFSKAITEPPEDVSGYPLLSPGERWETVMQGASDHHRGEHDWSSPDPYDCSVCHVYLDLLIEAVRRDERNRAEVVASAEQTSRGPVDESRP